MQQYRLKKEAVPFIKEAHATSIYPFDTWNQLGIDIKALELVKDPFITYGIKTTDKSSSLSGWAADDGSHFHFTIHFPSVKYREHDKFGKGRQTRDLMDRIQRVIDNYYIDFVNEPEPTLGNQ